MMENNKKKVIGIILAYKASSHIEELWNRIPKGVCDSIFISNDTAGDGTEEVAERLGIPCFSHPRLMYGGNVKYALKKALEMGADYIVEIHGDGQYDPSYIGPAVIKAKENDMYGMVLGSRFKPLIQPLRDKMPLPRYLANIGLSFIDRIILGTRASELHSGARLYNANALRKIDFSNTSDDFLFSFEIIAQTIYQGFKIGEVTVRCDYTGEHTSINYKSSTIYALKTFKVMFLFIAARLGFKTKLFPKK